LTTSLSPRRAVSFYPVARAHGARLRDGYRLQLQTARRADRFFILHFPNQRISQNHRCPFFGRLTFRLQRKIKLSARSLIPFFLIAGLVGALLLKQPIPAHFLWSFCLTRRLHRRRRQNKICLRNNFHLSAWISLFGFLASICWRSFYNFLTSISRRAGLRLPNSTSPNRGCSGGIGGRGLVRVFKNLIIYRTDRRFHLCGCREELALSALFRYRPFCLFCFAWLKNRSGK